MRKLNLDVDQIAVESFATVHAAPAGGTVRGMDSVTVDQDTCVTCGASCATCGGTCPASCPASCVNTCATCPASCDPVNCPSADGRC
jgi:hypothetical protein